ncbi:MAG: OmpA family protein [Cellvibrionaceae bacterium]|nr:OmpA family protein [Cellvibrionaceae bacterium]
MLHVSVRVSVAGLLLLLLTNQAFTQTKGLRKSLFEETEALLMKTKKANGALLAPVGYENGFAAYSRANKRYKKSLDVDKIEKDLAEASRYFEKCQEAIKLANLTFGSTIKARNDAKKAKSKQLAEDEWSRAEKRFKSAAVSLETGRISSARKKGTEAEEIYREAELISIQSSYLSEARRYIERAKREKVGRQAPNTLKQAEVLLRKAEYALTDSRYDADYPRSLAKQALYQAKHSIFLADYIKQLKKRDVTTEQLLLDMERPLILISDTLDMLTEFDEGFDVAALKVNKEVARLVVDSRDYVELRTKLEKLEIDYDNLDGRVSARSKRLAHHDSQQKRIKSISAMFSPEEADVFMKGDNIVIRAKGISFSPGSAKVKNRNFLRRLEQVFKVFNGYTVLIEGHTDSFGSDSTNLLLSFDRATAVRNYLVSNVGGLSDSNSDVRGYGETRPVANNETASGRAKNRRIDLVFTPAD